MIMKLLTNENAYVASNNRLEVSPDLKEVSAYSYNWWRYVATDKVGNVYFNDVTYSISTCKHQNETRRMLELLDKKPNVTLRHTSTGFQEGIEFAIQCEIKELRSIIKSLIVGIRRKGSHKRKNAERRDSIRNNLYRVKDLKRIVNEHVDKKPIPIKKAKLKPIWDLMQWKYDNTWDDYAIREAKGWKHWFVKPNGKLNAFEFTKFLNKGCHHNNPPISIDRVKQALEMKGNENVVWLLEYQFIADLENMMPHIDSKEYIQLLQWLKRQRNRKQPNNVFLLDKMHTYLTNKINRKSYDGDGNAFPQDAVLQALSGNLEHYHYITSDKELRAEGRKQRHCIGSKHYIAQCFSGYQACHYKGYTFFFNPELDLMETHGKYNAATPDKIQNELLTVIENTKLLAYSKVG